MILKKLIIGLGLLGAALRGSFIEAQGFLYCAQIVVCQNNSYSSCQMMGGNLRDYMYIQPVSKIINNEKILQFSYATGDKKWGSGSCNYYAGYWNNGSFVSFFTLQNKKIYPHLNHSNWGDPSGCDYAGEGPNDALNTDCPFTTTPPTPRARR